MSDTQCYLLVPPDFTVQYSCEHLRCNDNLQDDRYFPLFEDDRYFPLFLNSLNFGRNYVFDNLKQTTLLPLVPSMFSILFCTACCNVHDNNELAWS